MPDRRCPLCRALTNGGEAACADCRMHYGPLLLQACTQPGRYVLSLRGEGLVGFAQARYCADGVFSLEQPVLHRFWGTVPVDLRRRLQAITAIEVRYEDIVWLTTVGNG